MRSFDSTAILLVEDDLADVALTVELLREARLANRLRVISDGREAISQLTAAAEGEGPHPVPDLILLDLGLPIVSGRAVLKVIRELPALRETTVFILTGDEDQRAELEAEGLADGCLDKPIDLPRFLAAVLTHERFWLELVVPPRA